MFEIVLISACVLLYVFFVLMIYGTISELDLYSEQTGIITKTVKILISLFWLPLLSLIILVFCSALSLFVMLMPLSLIMIVCYHFISKIKKIINKVV